MNGQEQVAGASRELTLTERYVCVAHSYDTCKTCKPNPLTDKPTLVWNTRKYKTVDCAQGWSFAKDKKPARKGKQE